MLTQLVVGIYYFTIMKLTETQLEKIKPYLPVPRGNVKVDYLLLVNAILYVAENGCKWRSLPSSYGKWNTVYRRVNRWSKNGVLRRIFEGLQKERILSVTVSFLALDSTCIKVHPNGTGALKKTENSLSEKHGEDGIANFIWLPQMIKQ
jgi:transposase